MHGSDVPEAPTKIVKFMYPGSEVQALMWGQYDRFWKLLNLRKSFPLFPHIFEKNKCMVMVTMKPFTKIEKFITPGTGTQALG